MVVDCGSGSGVCAIAAALSHAASVKALDVDPVALTAVDMNARLNAVEICTVRADMSHGGFDGAETILAADAFYSCREYSRLLDHGRLQADSAYRRSHVQGVSETLL